MAVCHCGNEYPDARLELGYDCCLECGDKPRVFPSVPMHKSNYIAVMPWQRHVLKQLDPKGDR